MPALDSESEGSASQTPRPTFGVLILKTKTANPAERTKAHYAPLFSQFKAEVCRGPLGFETECSRAVYGACRFMRLDPRVPTMILDELFVPIRFALKEETVLDWLRSSGVPLASIRPVVHAQFGTFYYSSTDEPPGCTVCCRRTA